MGKQPMSATPFGEQERDALREIASIGSGHAATALGELTGQRIRMNIPDIRSMPAEQLINDTDRPDVAVAGVVFALDGPICGSVLYLMDFRFCQQMLSLLRQMDIRDFGDVDAVSLSALSEIGNIVVGSYVSAMAETAGLRIAMKPASIVIDMLGAILNYPLQFVEQLGDRVFLIEDVLTHDNHSMVGRLLILPDPDSLYRLLRHLGVADG